MECAHNALLKVEVENEPHHFKIDSLLEPSLANQSVIRISFRISGMVQGVGFRPFIYRTAVKNSLSGSVGNTSGGVLVEVEGTQSQIDNFLNEIQRKHPPLANIQQIEATVVTPTGETGFCMMKSDRRESMQTHLCPDIATCDECLRELSDPADRRFRYPFINCTNCGPRFSIVEEMPYDRPRTTMADFDLCPDCLREYLSPLDRRFHAEPVACPRCGPELAYQTADQSINAFGETALARAIDDLATGKIVALKGIGGYHLACDPFNTDAVKRLRDRKRRPARPLAVIFRDIEEIGKYCSLSVNEVSQLSRYERPILLLDKLPNNLSLKRRLVREISPGLNSIGAFLPYTPLHYLLMADPRLTALVMTSGNRSEEPIAVSKHEAATDIGSIADSFLHHNRRIWNRCDDSVGYIRENALTLIRRSRGFAPIPIALTGKVRSTLAVGAMYCNTFTLATGESAWLSQHIGDVENLQTLQFLQETIFKYLKWLKIEPEIIACDLHPDLLTSRFAGEFADGRPLIRIQHHHAHLAAVLAAHGFNRPAIGLVCDGTGYGGDGTIWGGEILFDDTRSIVRFGHLALMPLPGGDKAIRHPYRTAVGYLKDLPANFDPKAFPGWNKISEKEITVVNKMVENRFNTVLTSSVGRLFDAVAALLGICFINTYEGQAAIELEHTAARRITQTTPSPSSDLEFEHLSTNGELVIDVASSLQKIAELALAGVAPGQIAFDFHYGLGLSLAKAAVKAARECEVDTVALGGGVFMNRLLTDIVNRELGREGIKVLLPGSIPVNDGSISLGQAILANREVNIH